jgi:hypothetical protein
MRRPQLAAASAVFALALAAPAPGAPSSPGAPSPDGSAPPTGRELILPPSEVKDTFFAWLVGVVDAGRDVSVDNAWLREVLTEFHSTIALPFDRISVVRHTAPQVDGRGSLGILFDGAIDIPVPFSLLWYHPGSLMTTRIVEFEERRFSSVPLADGSSAGPVYSFRIADGAMTIDVDEWIDVLLGRIVDDLRIRIVAIVHWRGAWRCLIGGTGREGRRIIAAFDLARNAITFPVPSELTLLGLWLWNAW